MGPTPEYLAAKDREIERRVYNEYVDPTGLSEAITDGIVEPTEYINAPKRILWFLKEPYDDGDKKEGGGWSLTKSCLLEKNDEISRSRTFQPICYINYGIFKGIADWEQMPWLRDSEEIRHTLRKIAFINVSKLPGLKRSFWNEIADAYHKHRELLLAQIAAYTPQIIFACEPHIHGLAQDLGSHVNNAESFGSASALQLANGTRLVWVYHPAQTNKGLGRKNYVNDAIRASTAILAI